MRKLRQSEFARFGLAVAIALGAFGAECDQVVPTAASLPCDPNVVQITFWDSRVQKVCGCGGTDGEFATPGTALNCTFSLGKVVFVNYQGPYLQHQFMPVGTPALPSGPIFDPSARFPIRGHGFKPTATGTYQFRDEFDHSVFGTITITP